MLGEYLPPPSQNHLPADRPAQQYRIPPEQYPEYGIDPFDTQDDSISLDDIREAIEGVLMVFREEFSHMQQGFPPLCDGNGADSGPGLVKDVVRDGMPAIYVKPDGNISYNFNFAEQFTPLGTDGNGNPLYAVWMRFNTSLEGYGPDSYGFLGWGCASKVSDRGDQIFVWASELNGTVQLPNGTFVDISAGRLQSADAMPTPTMPYVPPPTETPFPTQPLPPTSTEQPGGLLTWLFGPDETHTPSPTASYTPPPPPTRTPISPEERAAKRDFNFFVIYPVFCIGGALVLIGIVFSMRPRGGNGQNYHDDGYGGYDDDPPVWNEELEQFQQEWGDEPEQDQ